jgi:hypothetical protein
MTRNPRRIGRRLLPLVAGWLLLAAPGASGAELRNVSRLHVTEVGTGSISLHWRDRSRGETRYEVLVDGPGGQRSRIPRNRESAQVRRLTRGARYELRVRACRRSRCGPARRSVRTATLLAPFNGRHPDPRCATFPGSDEFNRDVSGAPVDPRSDRIIDQINADGGNLLHPDFGSNPSYGIPFVVVPFGQPLVPIAFTAYGDESDPGPYPVPPGAPVEGGARSDGDRHVLVVRRPRSPGGDCRLFELYRAFERGGSRNRWEADSGAVFDLGSPLAGQRPDGWTSADAAGLPIYPGLVTLEEVRSGEIDHAIRITFEETRRGYLSPATHYASDSCDPDRPPMGLRLRLRAGYDLSGFRGAARVIAVALKRYGVINADNGSNWFISGSTDRRWDDENLNQLKDIPGSAFEVVRRGPETSDC